MDPADRADAFVEHLSDHGIQVAQSACRPQQQTILRGKVVCQDCEEELPDARAKAGRSRCTECQELIEKRMT